jgi:xanthine dehydrogenase small subunit
MYLREVSAYLKGKEIAETVILEAIRLAQTEISPISDARGSEAYKRLLLSQLIKAHFIKYFPRLTVDRLLAVV